MIKATGLRNGRPALFVGLTRRNLEKLLAEMMDTYIIIDKDVVGTSHDVVIFSGETEIEMAHAMRGSIGPDTKVNISDKLKQ